MSISQKHVIRFYAPYLSSSGIWRQKGFTTRMAAARFLAKQMLLDKVFGPKVEHYQSDDSDNGWRYWKRDTPDNKEDRAAKFAETYPLEECTCEVFNYFGEGLPTECEMKGFAVCRMRRDLLDWSNGFYHGRLTYGPDVAA